MYPSPSPSLHPESKMRKLLSLGKTIIQERTYRKLTKADGGGVRGMSSLAILRELMTKLAHSRGVDIVHPWQEFDMIDGTSTVSVDFSALEGPS
jgi:hypothetical protein